MRIFLAGATGAIGRRLVPLLLDAGHHVTGMTRSPARADDVRAAGADAVVADALDAGAVQEAVAAAQRDVIVHQLTDLGAQDFAANGRLRIAGTRNLVDAARAAGVEAMAFASAAGAPAPQSTHRAQPARRSRRTSPAPAVGAPRTSSSDEGGGELRPARSSTPCLVNDPKGTP